MFWSYIICRASQAARRNATWRETIKIANPLRKNCLISAALTSLKNVNQQENYQNSQTTLHDTHDNNQWSPVNNPNAPEKNQESQCNYQESQSSYQGSPGNDQGSQCIYQESSGTDYGTSQL